MTNQIPESGALPALSQLNLDEIIERHDKYLQGRKGGARAVIQYHNLSHLDFKSAKLSHADFTGSMFIQANFSNAILNSCNFFACDIRNANLRNADCSRADFRGAYVAGADFTGANMHEADMREGKIMTRDAQGILEDRKRIAGNGAKTVFTGAKFTGANMDGVQAFGADLTDADLSGVSINNADLTKTTFHGANLTDADLSGSVLSETNMDDAIIAGASMDNTEQSGISLTRAVTERDMGDKLENLGKSLPELLEEHTLWVSTIGKRGRQLDLGGYDLREVIDLKHFPLTAIKAIGANLLNQDLSTAEMQSAIFDKSDFRDCILNKADLRGSSFKYAKFSRAKMDNVQLCPLEFERDNPESRLQRADLSGADLRYVSMDGADLRDCILMGVDLTGAVLTNCDLRRADLTGAIMNGTVLEGAKLDDTIINLDDL